MRVSTNVWSRFITAALLASAVVALPGRAAAQCVGDCGSDGEVSISDLVTGVNIALGSQPVSACPAFANQQNEVTIAQLIQGVNNALVGCPPPPDTPTATATDRPPATATVTQSPAATGTATLAPSPTSTALQPSTPTATGIPTGTATATALSSTATATSPAPSTATATATLAAASTATSAAAPTASATPTVPPTATSSPTPSPIPSATAVPPGQSAAGRAAIVSIGLGSVQNLVGAIVTILTNDGGSAGLVFGVDQGVGGVAAADDCSISGTTSQDCVKLPSTALTLTLGAANCITAGPAGGEAEFNGGITLDAAPFALNRCAGGGNSVLFVSGTYAVGNLNVRFRDAQSQSLLNVVANLNGTFSLAGADAMCLVGGLNFSLNGTLTSTLADGSGVLVAFQNTQVVMDQITYNSDCVPVVYRLTFNGPAIFTPMPAGLFEAASALTAGAAASDAFAVSFTAFRLTQNATVDPVAITMSGNMTADCFGGTLGLSTFAPVAVAAGQLCPSSGVLDVSGGGTTARVTYDSGGVTVAPAVGAPEAYPSCLDQALLMCPA